MLRSFTAGITRILDIFERNDNCAIIVYILSRQTSLALELVQTAVCGYLKLSRDELRTDLKLDLMIVGTEWLIEAVDCDPELLRDERVLKRLIEAVISDLDLVPLGQLWHKFPGEGGVTGLVALTESHLACHTYPEHQIATFNLYCCRSRPEWGWKAELKQALSAGTVSVSKVVRGTTGSEVEACKPEFAEFSRGWTGGNS